MDDQMTWEDIAHSLIGWGCTAGIVAYLVLVAMGAA
jgi:hypothetical protein